MKTIEKKIEFIKKSGILNYINQFDLDEEVASFMHDEIYACNFTIGNAMYVNTQYDACKDDLIKHLTEEKYNFDKDNIKLKYVLIGPLCYWDEAFFFRDKKAFNSSIDTIRDITNAIYKHSNEEPKIKDFIDFINRYDMYKNLDNIIKEKTTTSKKLNKV